MYSRREALCDVGKHYGLFAEKEAVQLPAVNISFVEVLKDHNADDAVSGG